MKPDMDSASTRVLLAVMTQVHPTVRSVARACGLSLMTTHSRLRSLRKAGLVDWEDGRDGTLHETCEFVPTTQPPL